MTKAQALALLRGAWFVDMSGGKHTRADVAKAIGLAGRCLEEAKPYKAKARALKAENKALAKENDALRAELIRQAKALKAMLSHIVEENLSGTDHVKVVIRMPRDEYLRDVDPIESDPRYSGEPE